MNKKIIAIDFDGTLCDNKYPDIGVAKDEVIKKAIEEKENGAILILNTMREGIELQQACVWCEKHGLFFHAINDNYEELKAFYKNNPRKIFANEYWDDHNKFIDGVNENIRQESVHKSVYQMAVDENTKLKELLEMAVEDIEKFPKCLTCSKMNQMAGDCDVLQECGEYEKWQLQHQSEVDEVLKGE